jgi:CheY-like chemotaxis protein
VDDDPLVCDVVARTLRQHEYEVEVVHSGQEAWRRASELEVDVLLTDVRMPGELDGIDLYDRLVAKDPSFASRIVFMTGNILDGRTMERLDRLSVRCLQKPFDIHQLATLIGEVASAAPHAPDNGARTA